MIKSASLFSQLLNQIPRMEFQSLVTKHQTERHSKGFDCWTQLVSMLFCHLAHADSLREICNGLTCTLGKLRHLGGYRNPCRSTLSYANAHRLANLYRDLFYLMLHRFRSEGSLGNRKSKFRFKKKLLSLDSTTISLCLNLFPWAEFRRSKGGVKVHVLLDHDDYMPSFVLVSEARRHDKTLAKKFTFTPGSIIAFDRAYNDYRLFAQLTQEGVFFVTRMKDNAIYDVLGTRHLPQIRNILSDEDILLTGSNAHDKCPHMLRRITVWDQENQREIVLLTNHLKFGSTTISHIYRDRWEIELFFKTLKQHFKNENLHWNQ